MSHNDVYRVGDGPHAVLGLHGWFGAAESWRPLAPHLDGSRFSYYFLDYRAIIDLTTGNRLTDVWLDAAVQASLATSDKAAFGAYLGSWAKTDFHQQIEGNPVPVKVIVGEHDPALGEATMQATFVQWYPNCELEVLANAGQPLTRPVTHFS